MPPGLLRGFGTRAGLTTSAPATGIAPRSLQRRVTPRGGEAAVLSGRQRCAYTFDAVRSGPPSLMIPG
jgi:hypothetical protein